MTQLTWTYNTLTSALQNWLDDTDSDWANVTTLPQIVYLAEQKLVDDFDLTVFDLAAPITLPAGTGAGATVVARPPNIIVTDDMFYAAGAGQTNPGKLLPIERRDYSWILDYLDATVTGPPLYYAEQDVISYVFAPYADQSYTLTTFGPYAHQSLNDVNPSTGTTWMSNNMAQILLEAGLMEASKFLKNEGKRKVQEMVYNNKMGPMKLRLRALRRNTIDEPRMTGGGGPEGQLPAETQQPPAMGNALTRQ